MMSHVVGCWAIGFFGSLFLTLPFIAWHMIKRASAVAADDIRLA